MQKTPDSLKLSIPGFTFRDLVDPTKLQELSSTFFGEVKAKDPALHARFDEYRRCRGAGMSEVDISERIVAMAPHVSAFVERLFGVEHACKALRLRAGREQVIFRFKKEFFTRRALKKVSAAAADGVDLAAADRQVGAILGSLDGLPSEDRELTVAAAVTELAAAELALKTAFDDATRSFLRELALRLGKDEAGKALLPPGDEDASSRALPGVLLGVFERWLVAHYHRKTPAMRGWATFRQPASIDYRELVEKRADTEPVPQTLIGPQEHYRRRLGFDLTDPRYTPREVMSEVDYCIFCHERGKDSCSKGFRDGNAFKTNPVGYALKGCPLDQKISESHVLRGRGDAIGALALIAIDNPMCPGTGHRICNDCMKACIYQKQDPVNIPQVETGILTDVLGLPWGFEIYSLLTRWNPLNVQQPQALPYNGKNVLVVGMGPAGYTLAHYFLNEGFGVVGIDGLKIEPLPAELVGDADTPFPPVRDVTALYRKLSDRVLMGFGGVSEYGITVRWDKNFLTVIYLNLVRREHFRVYDGVRFGGTLTVADAWDLGFDHVALATGAGKPTFVTMKNNLIRGIRKASDFLMALQLTGAGKRDSMANLQIRLPAVVIGGGLTAIDTATELMAYYPVQVTKIKRRYDKLCARYGKAGVDAMFTEEDRKILATFLEHAEAFDREDARAAAAGELPNYIPLIRSWGGVQLVYRKSINDAPAYRLNHEEIIKGFEEGIRFVEHLSPLEAVPDEYGALKEVVFERMAQVGGKWKNTGEQVRIAARSMLVAAGTVPNVMYEREHPNTFRLDDRDEFFQKYTIAEDGELVPNEDGSGDVGFFTSHRAGERYVSFYGDNHPDYEGNVVKAMASAKHGFRKVRELFGDSLRPASAAELSRWKSLVGTLDDELRPRVVEVVRLTPTIVEAIVRAPRAARRFEPGQFFRLQNYEVDSPRKADTLLMMEGLALTGAWVDKARGLLSLIVLEFGSSTRMVSMLKPGQRVVVMGPTGTPTEIPENSTVLLLGGGLGNAVLFSIAKACKEKGSRVVYFAGYKKREDLFKREEIEAATDVVVYSVDAGEPIPARRPQDRSFVGNIIQAMLAYAKGELGEVPIPLGDAHRVIAIGSDRMMAAVTQARHTVLAPYMHEDHIGIVSINSPMQCMMKAVCAQCLQRQVIPGTNEEVFVFSCVNQDQRMDEVDFTNLNSRLRANSVMEKISNRWLDYVLETGT